MYGRYNLNSLKGIINTINALHDRQSYYEWAIKQRDFNFRKNNIDAVNYNFDTMMCKAQPRHTSLGYPFHNTAAHIEATPTREGI